MALYAGIKIVIECFPSGANPWIAEVDLGPRARAASGMHGPRTVITAASLAALCTAIQSTTSGAGAT